KLLARSFADLFVGAFRTSANVLAAVVDLSPCVRAGVFRAVLYYIIASFRYSPIGGELDFCVGKNTCQLPGLPYSSGWCGTGGAMISTLSADFAPGGGTNRSKALKR
ncbi:MAG: hypothetical protein ACOYLD_15985, partial [Anaerohalosphaeraceae bacterium]